MLAQDLEALEAFHTGLLPRTFVNALRAPFYREWWDGRDAGSCVLPSLPFVHRRQIVDAGLAAQVQTGEIREERFTGGTTGAPFPVAVGRNEQAVLKTFYQEVFSSGSDRKLRRGARFQNIHITFDRFIPVPIRFHTLSYESNGTFEYFIRRVLGTHAEHGVEDVCTILSGIQPALMALTHYAQAHAGPAFESTLETIYTYGSYLAPSTRRALEEFWGATVIDRYGMSEAIGGATEAISGWYYFDPVSIPEVVDPVSHAPVTEGIGALVVTALYPFQQCQPLVRYWTGDLVRVTHRDTVHPGRLAVRPLGRLDQGVICPLSGSYLLTPDCIFRVLEAQPNIRRKRTFLDTRQVLHPELVGYPLFKVRPAAAPGEEVALEIRLLDNTRAAQTCAEVHAALLLEAPDLGNAVASRLIGFVVESVG